MNTVFESLLQVSAAPMQSYRLKLVYQQTNDEMRKTCLTVVALRLQSSLPRLFDFNTLITVDNLHFNRISLCLLLYIVFFLANQLLLPW